MRRTRTLAAGLAAGAALLVSSAGLAGGSVRAHAVRHTSVGTITIGTENFPEEEILGNLYNDVLKAAGFSTHLRANLGPRPSVIPAMQKGQIDLVPEYAGSLLAYLNPKVSAATTTSLTTDVPALNTELNKFKATTLTAAPAVDTNVFVVTRATAAKYHLTTLSSLAKVSHQLTLGAPTECPTNAYCEVGLKSRYGISFKGFKALEESLAVSGLKSNTIQVAELFSSDGTVSSNGFVALTDDKHLQPADHIIPVILQKDATTGVKAAINKLSAKLTTEVLEQLNLSVSNDHKSAAAVAQAWLVKAGLIKA